MQNPLHCLQELMWQNVLTPPAPNMGPSSGIGTLLPYACRSPGLAASLAFLTWLPLACMEYFLS